MYPPPVKDYLPLRNPVSAGSSNNNKLGGSIKLVGFAALALFSVASVAHARPSTYNMSCAEARGLVQANGAVVMNYGYHDRAGHLYERFVAHGGYCLHGEITRPAWVPTTDNTQCFIGYTCEHHSGD